jgi:hypothetical protein
MTATDVPVLFRQRFSPLVAWLLGYSADFRMFRKCSGDAQLDLAGAAR